MSNDQPRQGRDRAGSTTSPMGSTAAIVIAVVAVVAGFLILKQIRDDGSGTGSSIDTGTTLAATDGSDPAGTLPIDPTLTTVPVDAVTTTTVAAAVTDGAVVIVANASTVDGAAGQMKTALQGKKFTLGTSANATLKSATTEIQYDATNTAALAVATYLSTVLGNAPVKPLGSPVPVSGGALTDSATVLVMLGSDYAGKTLEQIAAGAGTAGTPVAGATTTVAVGAETTTSLAPG